MLRGTYWGHFLVLKTSCMLNINKFSITISFFILRLRCIGLIKTQHFVFRGSPLSKKYYSPILLYWQNNPFYGFACSFLGIFIYMGRPSMSKVLYLHQTFTDCVFWYVEIPEKGHKNTGLLVGKSRIKYP